MSTARTLMGNMARRQHARCKMQAAIRRSECGCPPRLGRLSEGQGTCTDTHAALLRSECGRSCWPLVREGRVYNALRRSCWARQGASKRGTKHRSALSSADTAQGGKGKERSAGASTPQYVSWGKGPLLTTTHNVVHSQRSIQASLRPCIERCFAGVGPTCSSQVACPVRIATRNWPQT